MTLNRQPRKYIYRVGVVSSNSIKFSIILFTGIVLGYVNTILVFPNVLTEEELGLTRILMSSSAVIAQLAQLGTGNIMVRFHPYLKDDHRNISLSIGLLLSFIGLSLASAFMIIFDDFIISHYQEKSALFTQYFYLVMPFSASLMIYHLFDAYLRVIFKNNVSAILNSIILRLLWLALVCLYYLGFFDTATFMNLYVGCQVLTMVLAFSYVAYLGKLNITFKFSAKHLQSLKKMYSFGVFTIISGLSLFLINRLDMLMVGKYIGLDAVAIYFIAFTMSTVILVPAQSISRTAIVIAANAAKDNDMKTLDVLYKKTALNQLLFGSLIFLLILVNYNSIMTFLPIVYRDSFSVFFLLGIAKIIDTGLGINGAILLHSKYYKVDTVLSIILLMLAFVTNIYFIPIYGIEGAAMATMLSIIIFNVSRFLFIKIKLNITPFTLSYLGVVLIMTASTGITYLMPTFSSVWIDMVLRSSLLLILSLPGVYLLRLSPDFNKMVNSFLSAF